MDKNRFGKRNKWIAVLLIMVMAFDLFVPFRTQMKALADSTYAFTVRVSYDVENENDESTNKIRVYYWEPTENGYEFKNNYALLSSVAKSKGTHTKAADIPGPVQSVEIYVHGSVTDATQYYVTNIELETQNVVEGCNKNNKTTLWDGKWGCSVATMGSNTIYDRLTFNSPDGESSNSKFYGWHDPGTELSALFGDDKYERTNSCYPDACKKPEPEGLAGFDVIGLSEDLYVPTDNQEKEYKFSVKNGTVYDHFGAKWPGAEEPMKVSKSVDNGIDLQSDGSDAYTLKIGPRANADSDYTLSISGSKNNLKSGKAYKIHTFQFDVYVSQLSYLTIKQFS